MFCSLKLIILNISARFLAGSVLSFVYHFTELINQFVLFNM